MRANLPFVSVITLWLEFLSTYNHGLKPATKKLTNRYLEKKGFKFDPKNEQHWLWTSELKHQFWKEHNNSVSGVELLAYPKL